MAMPSPSASAVSPSDAGSPHSLEEEAKAIIAFNTSSNIKPKIRRPSLPRHRVKVSHQKVRTGCARCKQRRIKCDETTPHCLRCLRINEPCPGYQQPVARVFGLQTFEGFVNDFEKLCFDSFFAGGSSRLALFQPSTKSFWTTILPQLCQVYLPLRHAVIALAYINEPFYSPGMGAIAQARGPVDTLGVVMSHFNKALRIFGVEMDRLSIEAKVSCCIVFTALTMYLYRVGGVSSHVSAAWHFLQQHDAAKKIADPAVRQVLAPSVRRLVINACTFSGGMNGLRDGDVQPYEEYMYEVLRVPASFDNYQDAYECLGNLLKYGIALSVGNVEHGTRVDTYLQSSLRRFELVMSKSRIETCAGKQLSGTEIAFHRKDLLLQHRVARLISWFRPEMLECSYWVFIPEFRAILYHIKELIRDEPDDPWRVTLGWLPPLFLIATKCRFSALRREALQLLHQLNRVERGWTSCVAYALATFVIDQEEPSGPYNLAALYPQYVHLLSVRFDQDEQFATVAYLAQEHQTNLGTFSAQLPIRALSKTMFGAPAINIPDPVLQAFGYTGTTMFSPRAQCHCLGSRGGGVQYKGVVTETGQEEIVVWEAGIATFKAVRDQEQPNGDDGDSGKVEEKKDVTKT